MAPLGPLATVTVLPQSLGLTAFLWVLRPVFSQLYELYARIAPEGDHKVFAEPEVKAMFLDDILNGSRRVVAAPVLDFLLFGRPWAFSVRDITVPVRWWHGDADNIVPLSHGQHMVEALVHAR